MLVIRDATPADIEDLTEIYNWAVLNTTATFDLSVVTPEARMEWLNHHGGAFPLIVSELDGKVVGYCSLSTYREKPAYDKTVELSVYIHPNNHNQGHGEMLMREIITRAKTLGYHVIMSGITAGNAASIHLHEKLLFTKCAYMKEVGYKFDSWQDVVFYQLIL